MNWLIMIFLINIKIERSIDVQNSFIRILVSFLFSLGFDAAVTILEWIIDGPCSESFCDDQDFG